MKHTLLLTTLISLLLIQLPAWAQKKGKLSKNKQTVIESIKKQQAQLIKMSDEIWAHAETALEEHESSKVLSDYAKAQGFEIQLGVAEMPTAFVASYGSGKPVIGIMGEFDALPGISQKASPVKESYEKGAPGHGCGHNMFGVGSLGAAVAVKELIEAGKLQGTVRFYGTPAEETIFGKLYMARAGLFDDVDICLDWHPGAAIEASAQSSQALIDFTVSFQGQAAHAALDPWNGRSALDGLEFYTTGLNYIREHVEPSVRIHYMIQHGGDVVNVVPEHAQIWTRIRDSKREGMLAVYERVKKLAEGAAMMAEVGYEIKLVSGLHEVLVNREGAAALQTNLDLLGPIEYTAEEEEFAKKIQESTGKEQVGLDGTVKPLRETKEHPPGGSSDVGDISWLVPEISLSATTAPVATPWHSWAVVACGGMSIGHKGMTYAAKSLAMTMVDVFEDADLRDRMWKEFKERKGDYKYEAILPAGPPPVPEKK